MRQRLWLAILEAWYAAPPAIWLLLIPLLSLLFVELGSRLLRVSMLSAVGWSLLRAVAWRHRGLTLAVARGSAWIAAAARWMRGKTYRAADAPEWAVLLCEDRLLELAAAGSAQVAAAASHEKVQLWQTMAAMYGPTALGRLWTCRRDPESIGRSLWFAALASTQTQDSTHAERMKERLLRRPGAEPMPEYALNPCTVDALRVVDLLSRDTFLVDVAVRHFLTGSTGSASNSWPGPIARLLPWLDSLSHRGDFHGLAAAGLMLLRRFPICGELAPICERLAFAHQRLAQLTPAGSALAQHYLHAAASYADLARDLGPAQHRSSHPGYVLRCAAESPAAAAAQPAAALTLRGSPASMAGLRQIPSWRSPGWWLAAGSLSLWTLMLTEAALVYHAASRFQRDGSWDLASAPGDCLHSGGRSYAVSDPHGYWLLDQQALAHYSFSTHRFTCHRLTDQDPASLEPKSLSNLLHDDGIAALRAGKNGPLVVTSSGRLASLVVDGALARLTFLNGPFLQRAPAEPPAPEKSLLALAGRPHRLHLSDGHALFTYDAQRHGFQTGSALPLAEGEEPQALLGTAPEHVWLGTSAGLYWSKDSTAKLQLVGKGKVERLLALRPSEPRALAFTDESCEAGSSVRSVGRLRIYSPGSEGLPTAAEITRGCQGAGPAIAELWDLMAGADTIWALTAQNLWTYDRKQQSWQRVMQKLPRARTGWLLGKGRAQTMLRFEAHGLAAYSLEGVPRWRWAGALTGGPYVSGDGLSFRGKKTGDREAALYWASGETEPVELGMKPDSESLRPASVMASPSHLCYAEPTRSPLRCLERSSGFLRRVCPADGDCSWGGAAPALRLDTDGQTLLIGRTGGGWEKLPFEQPSASLRSAALSDLSTLLIAPRPASPGTRLSSAVKADPAGPDESPLFFADWIGQRRGGRCAAPVRSRLQRLRDRLWPQRGLTLSPMPPVEPPAITAAESLASWRNIFALFGLRPEPQSAVALVEQLTALQPVAGDEQGIYLATASGQLLRHDGGPFCGFDCLRPSSGNMEAQQKRSVALQHGTSRGVSVACTNKHLLQPRWTCVLSRAGRTASHTLTGALFPTDHVKEIWRDEAFTIYARDQLGYPLNILETGELVPAQLDAVKPEAEPVWPLSGWEIRHVAASHQPLELPFGLQATHKLGADRLVERAGGRELAFGHDRVLDVAEVTDAACERCTYTLSQWASAPPRSGVSPDLLEEDSGPVGAVVLARGFTQSPWPIDGQLLTLPRRPVAVAAHRTAVLLAYHDRVIELDPNLALRSFALPLRWPKGAHVRSLHLTQLEELSQVLVVPENRQLAPAQLLETARFARASAESPPTAALSSVSCPPLPVTTPDQGDRCADASGEPLMILRHVPEAQTWFGWRYRVHRDGKHFCRLGATQCRAPRPAGLPQAAYAIVNGDTPAALRTALFSMGARIDGGERILLPGRRYVIEAIPRTEEWMSPRTDPLIALHADVLPGDCGDIVAVSPHVDPAQEPGSAGRVHSTAGCTAIGQVPDASRLRLPQATPLHVRIARRLLGRTEDSLALDRWLSAPDLAVFPQGLVVRRAGLQLAIMQGGRVFPP